MNGQSMGLASWTTLRQENLQRGCCPLRLGKFSLLFHHHFFKSQIPGNCCNFIYCIDFWKLSLGSRPQLPGTVVKSSSPRSDSEAIVDSHFLTTKNRVFSTTFSPLTRVARVQIIPRILLTCDSGALPQSSGLFLYSKNDGPPPKLGHYRQLFQNSALLLFFPG